jgi:hypothetical protein
MRGTNPISDPVVDEEGRRNCTIRWTALVLERPDPLSGVCKMDPSNVSGRYFGPLYLPGNLVDEGTGLPGRQLFFDTYEAIQFGDPL